jgi:hypothetical protein
LHHSTASSSIITSISVAAPSAKSIASWPTTLRTYSPVHHAKPLLLHTRGESAHPQSTTTTTRHRRRRRRISAAAPSAENKGSPAKQQLISSSRSPHSSPPPIAPTHPAMQYLLPNNSCSTQQVVDDDDEEEPLLHAPETQTPETPSTTLARPQTASQTDRRTDGRTA